MKILSESEENNTMKKGKFICRAAALGMTLGICFSMAAFANVQNETSKTVLSALPVKALDPKQLEENPYIAKSDSNVHNDGYNTDTTDEVLPSRDLSGGSYGI